MAIPASKHLVLRTLLWVFNSHRLSYWDVLSLMTAAQLWRDNHYILAVILFLTTALLSVRTERLVKQALDNLYRAHVAEEIAKAFRPNKPSTTKEL